MESQLQVRGRPYFEILVRCEFKFSKLPKYDFPPLRSPNMTTEVVKLEQRQYRPRERRWAWVAISTRIQSVLFMEIL